MSRFESLGPHLIAAPPPWLEQRPLPYDPEPTPGAEPCRRCRRVDSALEAELIAAYDSIHSLEELLVWLGEEHEHSNQWREEAEREVEGLQGLLGEFERLAGAKEKALESGRRSVVAARARTAKAEKLAAAERARASRLAVELKRVKEDRAASRPSAAPAAVPVAAAVAASSPRAAGDDATLAFAAIEAGETDGRILSLEAELRRERVKVTRYARYVEALEGRLRQIADQGEPAAAGSTAREVAEAALALAPAGTARAVAATRNATASRIPARSTARSSARPAAASAR